MAALAAAIAAKVDLDMLPGEEVVVCRREREEEELPKEENVKLKCHVNNNTSKT